MSLIVPGFPARRIARAGNSFVRDPGGIPNLFVSDGSLFPSSAAANPMLTIVALAIRQAGHLAERMARRKLWPA